MKSSINSNLFPMISFSGYSSSFKPFVATRGCSCSYLAESISVVRQLGFESSIIARKTALCDVFWKVDSSYRA
jgi:hypothetical protein